MKQFLLFIFLFSFTLLNAQQEPWHSKLVVRYPSGVTDTVWFGLDVNAGDGFDQGLDSLDTNLVHPISILSQDELVRQQYNTPYCGNLRRNYKEFKTGIVEFEFWVKSDMFPYDPDPNSQDVVSLWYDSTDFYFNTPDYRVTLIKIFSIGGYFHSIDLSEWGLYGINSPVANSGRFVNLFQEQTPSICSNSGGRIFGFKMEVWINLFLSIENESQEDFITVLPNPGSGKFKVQHTAPFTGNLRVTDLTGKTFYNEKLNALTETEVFLTAPPGMYFLQIFPEGKAVPIVKKIIINNSN